jgi:hypothetical protein
MSECLVNQHVNVGLDYRGVKIPPKKIVQRKMPGKVGK